MPLIENDKDQVRIEVSTSVIKAIMFTGLGVLLGVAYCTYLGIGAVPGQGALGRLGVMNPNPPLSVPVDPVSPVSPLGGYHLSQMVNRVNSARVSRGFNQLELSPQECKIAGSIASYINGVGARAATQSIGNRAYLRELERSAACPRSVVAIYYFEKFVDKSVWANVVDSWVTFPPSMAEVKATAIGIQEFNNVCVVILSDYGVGNGDLKGNVIGYDASKDK